MTNIQRVLLRLVGLACLLVGVVGFIYPFKTYDEDSLYKVTTHSRGSGRTISEKIETGAQLHAGQRIGALIVWGTKPDKG